jgi:hypothetical protein
MANIVQMLAAHKKEIRGVVRVAFGDLPEEYSVIPDIIWIRPPFGPIGHVRDKVSCLISAIPCAQNGENVVVQVAEPVEKSGLRAFEYFDTNEPPPIISRTLTCIGTRLDAALTVVGITPDKLRGWSLDLDLNGGEADALLGLGDYINCFDSIFVRAFNYSPYKDAPSIGDIRKVIERHAFRPRYMFFAPSIGNHYWALKSGDGK